MRRNNQYAPHLSAFCAALAISGYVHAEQKTSNKETQEIDKKIERMIVRGSPIGTLSLTDGSSTASRLGLTAMETPATIEIIDAELMRARGYTKLSDSLANLPGVVAGEHPTAPSTFSMRGFSRGQVTVLRDGLWIGPSTMVMRPQNTFNLDRVEILRGPASVLNGIGSVAGTVNAITKTAYAGMDNSTNLQLGYGSHNSSHMGIGIQGELNADLWYTVDASRYASDGYVKRTDSKSNNVTSSFLWQANDDLSFKLSADYLNDDVGSYFGTPLVPASHARDPLGIISTSRGEVLDGAMRFNNYNVTDAYAKSDQLFLRLDTDWQINDHMRLQHTFFKFDAERAWQNAEGYVYCTEIVGTCTSIGEVQRYYGYFILDHEQEVLGHRLTLNINANSGDIDSRFVVGFEKTNLDFTRTRGFRRQVAQSEADAVDAFNPESGVYGQRELRGTSPTDLTTEALFFGNALQLTDDWSLVTGARYEELQLIRKNFNAEGIDEESGFDRDYHWVSWRIGSVYNVDENMMLYGQYSNAKDPINSNIFLVSNNQNFDLTDATQFEVGLKASWMQGKAETTLAYFNIERDDILERFSLDSVTNVGGRTSDGFEFSTSLVLSEHWRLGVNAAYTQAKFLKSANFDEFAGNTPPNVPELTANIYSSYDKVAGLPLEVGASVHFIDDRYGDNPNTVTLNAYTLTNLFAAYKGESYRITARVDNLFDKPYVPWSDVFYLHQDNPNFIYANELLIGAPRSVRVMLDYQF